MNIILEVIVQCDTNIDLNLCIYSRSVTYMYLSWSSYFAVYLEDYSLDKCHNWDIGSM